MEERKIEDQEPRKEPQRDARLNPENTAAQIAQAHGEEVEPNQQMEEEPQGEEKKV